MGTLASGSIDLNSLKIAGEPNKYITRITQGGIKVHDAGDLSNYAQIDSNGMQIYKSNGNTSDKIAEFSENITLGAIKDTSGHITIRPNGIFLYDKENYEEQSNPFFLVRDLRNINDGQALVTDSFIIGQSEISGNLATITGNESSDYTIASAATITLTYDDIEQELTESTENININNLNVYSETIEITSTTDEGVTIVNNIYDLSFQAPISSIRDANNNIISSTTYTISDGLIIFDENNIPASQFTVNYNAHRYLTNINNLNQLVLYLNDEELTEDNYILYSGTLGNGIYFNRTFSNSDRLSFKYTTTTAYTYTVQYPIYAITIEQNGQLQNFEDYIINNSEPQKIIFTSVPSTDDIFTINYSYVTINLGNISVDDNKKFSVIQNGSPIDNGIILDPNSETKNCFIFMYHVDVNHDINIISYYAISSGYNYLLNYEPYNDIIVSIKILKENEESDIIITGGDSFSSQSRTLTLSDNISVRIGETSISSVSITTYINRVLNITYKTDDSNIKAMGFGLISENNYGAYSSTFGYNHKNYGFASNVTGMSNICYGSTSIIGGSYNTNTGDSSFIIGDDNLNSGSYSLIEGTDNQNIDSYCHVEGYSNNVRGKWLHVEGKLNGPIYGEANHVEGSNNEVQNIKYAHVQNLGNIANKQAQTVIGTYNKLDGNTTTNHSSKNNVYGRFAFVIGNGANAGARSNAFTVEWNGITTMANQLKVLAGGATIKGATTINGSVTINNGTLTVNNGVISAKKGLTIPINTRLQMGVSYFYANKYNGTNNFYYNTPGYHSFYAGNVGVLYIYKNKISLLKHTNISGGASIAGGTTIGSGLVITSSSSSSHSRGIWVENSGITINSGGLTINGGGASITGTVTTSSTITAGASVEVPNGSTFRSKTTGGTTLSLCHINDGNDLVFGGGSYSTATSTTVYYQGAMVRIRSTGGQGVVLDRSNNYFRPYTTNATALGTTTYYWTRCYCNTAEWTASDRKLKDSIDSIDFAKDLIMGLQPVQFKLKANDHRRTHMGFIAQDASTLSKKLNKNLSFIIADYIDNSKSTYLGEEVDDNELNWGLAYTELIAPMVQVIQEQQKEIDELKERIQTLENK